MTEKEIAMRPQAPGRESGFSLVELMIALVITLVVSGAIYGLLAGGQNAFRREPELAERQQNIRAAMDMIMRDISTAGVQMPRFVQTYTRGLNACAACPMGPDGQRTDDLEVLANPGNFEPEDVCGYQDTGASHIRTVRGRTGVPEESVIVIFFPTGEWTIRHIESIGGNNGGPGTCTPAEYHTDLSFRPGRNAVSDINQPSGLCAPASIGTSPSAVPCEPNQIGQGEVITYRVREDANGVPNLERRSTGSLTGDFGAPGAFSVVARGVEDLQVQYIQSDGTETTGAPGAPQVINDNYNSLITQLRVTLSARSMAQNIQGATTRASADTAIRGRLTQVGAMRPALQTLQTQPGTGGAPSPFPMWQ